MPLELWILLALGAVAIPAVFVVRRRLAGRRGIDPETGNVYPLW
jgi:hypothetical protein